MSKNASEYMKDNTGIFELQRKIQLTRVGTRKLGNKDGSQKFNKSRQINLYLILTTFVT